MTQALATAYDVGAARRSAMLAASTLAQAATAVMVHGPAFLIPALHAGGMSLAEAGLVAASPTISVMLTKAANNAGTSSTPLARTMRRLARDADRMLDDAEDMREDAHDALV